jgi:PAS domain S-box-containing protein
MSEQAVPTEAPAEAAVLALLRASADWLWEWDAHGTLQRVHSGRTAAPTAALAAVGKRLEDAGWSLTLRSGRPAHSTALASARAGFSVLATVHLGTQVHRYELTAVAWPSAGGGHCLLGAAREIVPFGWQLLDSGGGTSLDEPGTALPRWTMEPATDTLQLNAALARLLLLPAEHGAWAWWKELLGDDIELFSLAVSRTLDEGDDLLLEHLLPTRRGLRWMRITAQRRISRDGRRQLEGQVEDIHEQALLQRAHEEHLHRHERLFFDMPLACLVFDIETLRMLEGNHAAEELYGLTRAQLLDSDLSDLLDPAEQLRFSEMQPLLALRPGLTDDSTWRHRRADGKTLHVRVRGSTIEWEGRAARMVFVMDTTQQRAAALEMRLLYECLEHAADMIVVTQAERNEQGEHPIIYVNRAFERVTGYAREQVIGRDPRMLQGPATQGAELRRVSGCLARWEPVVAELINYDARGQAYWVEMTLTPVADESGWFHYWFAVERDVTHRKRAALALAEQAQELERRVEERTRELRETVRAMESFSRSVSHDLQNPLNGVLGFAELLQRGHAAALPPDAARMLSMIQRSARHMQTIIQDLLVLSRVRKMEPRPVRFDPVPMLKSQIDELRAGEPERRLTLRCPPSVRMHCDLQLFRVAFENLVANAWKYTRRREEAVIELQAQHTRGGVILSVRDNGAGFDPVTGAQLFTAFHRLHGDREFPGNGIGLATVAQAVERLGGWVWAEGSPQEGACFHIFLPHIEVLHADTVSAELEPGHGS